MNITSNLVRIKIVLCASQERSWQEYACSYSYKISKAKIQDLSERKIR